MTIQQRRQAAEQYKKDHLISVLTTIGLVAWCVVYTWAYAYFRGGRAENMITGTLVVAAIMFYVSLRGNENLLGIVCRMVGVYTVTTLAIWEFSPEITAGTVGIICVAALQEIAGNPLKHGSALKRHWPDWRWWVALGFTGPTFVLALLQTNEPVAVSILWVLAIEALVLWTCATICLTKVWRPFLLTRPTQKQLPESRFVILDNASFRRYFPKLIGRMWLSGVRLVEEYLSENGSVICQISYELTQEPELVRKPSRRRLPWWLEVDFGKLISLLKASNFVVTVGDDEQVTYHRYSRLSDKSNYGHVIELHIGAAPKAAGATWREIRRQQTA